MKLEELTGIELEDFADKCFDDFVLVHDFVELKYEQFEEYMRFDIDKDKDSYCDYEFRFCEKHMDDFLQFCLDKQDVSE